MVVTKRELTPDEARLDGATKLCLASRAVWRPTVGEHSIQVVRGWTDPDENGERIPDPVRSRKEGQRRARVQVRRWCVHNHIRRLVTLTFGEEGGCHDRDEVLRRLRSMLRGLGKEIPSLRYIYALELHPGGHGFHVHIGVNTYMRKTTLRKHWPWGFVDIRLLKAKAVRGQREQARRTASYLAKYACKAEDEGRSLGRHRYERSQGSNPTEERIEGSWGALTELFEDKGAFSLWTWDSATDEQWCGPRTLIFRE